MTPKRETIMSTLAGTNAWDCASARMNSAVVPSRSARARAAAISGSEISMPMGATARSEQACDGKRGAARAAADVEHDSTGSRGHRLDEQLFERLE
jgi:hypothetical protein